MVFAQNKYALVIGNGSYKNIENLANPVNDASDVAAGLRRLGYQVDLKTNLGNADMGRAIGDYIRRLAGNPANEGFFWYAGHGVQIEGENYLLPVDISANDSVDIEYGSYPLNRLLRSFEESARNKLNVVILDACRNNPFKNLSGRGRAVGRGLTVVNNLPQDLFVVFSTAAGEIAADGERGRRNSPFAEAFLKYMESPELLHVVISDVTRETLALTGNKQRPFQQGSIISERYYSLNPQGAQAPVQTTAVRPQTQTTVPTTTVQRTNPPVKPPEDAVSFFRKGKESYDQKDYDQAIDAYTQAIRLNPNYTEAYYNRGSAYYYKKDYDRTIGDFTQAIRLNPNLATAYNNRGLAYYNKNDYDRAIGDFTQAIRLNPNYANAYYNRGLAYYNKNDYDRAIGDFTQAIRLNPNVAAAYNNRGLAYNNKNDYDRAIGDYTQAIRLNPNDANAYNNRGLAYYNKNDYDRAIGDYTQAIRLNPNDALAYTRRGNAYNNKKDYDRAIGDHTEAIRLNPNYAMAYYNRGTVYHNKKDYNRAIGEYTQAIRLDPNYALAYTNRGDAYKAKGDTTTADADYAEAARLNKR
jgi:tetratricopeptide (TPR) repeat protein